MPVTKSAEKEMRVAKRRQARNKSARTRCKTKISAAEKLIFAGQMDEAKKVVTDAISCLDKAAEQGVIHPNNAARRKSRLMKKLIQAGVSEAEKSE